MFYVPILLGLISAISVESFKIHGQEARLDVVSCSYPPREATDKNSKTVSITDTTTENDPHYRELSFHLNDKDVKVNLKPSDKFLIHKNTPVWMVKRENDNVQFKLQTDALKDIESYTDETTHSSFVKLPDNSGGNYFYYGVYDYSIGVKAPPKEHARRRREVRDNKTVSSADHVVFTLPKSSNFDLATAYTSFIPDLRNATSELPSPDTVYPEILVIMDHKLYSHYNGKLQEALSYIITFWNAVDLKYRDLRQPAVKLNIAGIIIEEEDGALLYHSKILQDGKFKGKVDRNFVLDDIGYNLYRSPLEIGKNYDLALYMMGNDLVRPIQEEIEKKHGLDGILGVAKIGCSCIKDDAESIIDAVGAFEDSNGYIGLLHAAHELAHLFGASHDGERGIPQFGLPGGENCQPNKEDDYIMSTKRIDGKYFSPCAKEAMRAFFHKQSAECLRNPPMTNGEFLSSITLPGKKVSLDEQCASAGFLRAHFNDTSVCDHLYCIAKESDDGVEYVTSLPGAEGSICDRGYHCLNGRCVQNENSDEYLRYRAVDKRIYIGK